MTVKISAVRLVLLAILFSVGSVHAAGKFYIGAKVAVADADIPAFDRTHLAGIYGGYNLVGKDSHFQQDFNGGTLAVEGEALATIRKGDAGASGDWNMTSFAVFAAYRHPLTDYLYLKGRAGLVRYDIDVDVPPGPAGTGTETGVAAGLGAGLVTGPGRLEVEFTTYEGDVNLLSVGFHMSF
jgi:hypothetical protein